jgi:hypothetical protein
MIISMYWASEIQQSNTQGIFSLKIHRNIPQTYTN